jgi:hypothetical protein
MSVIFSEMKGIIVNNTSKTIKRMNFYDFKISINIQKREHVSSINRFLICHILMTKNDSYWDQWYIKKQGKYQ